MVHIGTNSISQVSKLNFGAYDNAPTTAGPIMPAPISSNPYEERHGYLKNDVYGVKSNNADMKPIITRPTVDLFPQLERMPDGKRSNTPGSILKPLIILGLTIGGITLAIKKRKSIAKIFKKTKEPEKLEVTSFNRLNQLHQDLVNKTNNDKISEFKLPEKVRIILDGKNGTERKEALEKAYAIARASANNEVQPKIKVLMPNELAEQAKEIVDKIKVNQIDDIDMAHIEKIEGFEIVKTGNPHTDIAVEKQVRHGIDTDSIPDKGNTLWRRFCELFRYP